MQTSQEHQSSSSIQRLYYQPMQQIEPYCLPHFQILDSNVSSGSSSQGAQVSLQNFDEQFFTLESSPAIDYVIYNSPSTGSISSNRSPFSPMCSQSYGSDPHYSPDNIYGSPFSGSSIVGDGSGIQHVLRELEVELLESDIDDSSSCSFNCVVPPSSLARSNRILEMAANSDLTQVLIACAEALSDADMSLTENLMDLLEHRVSVYGDPVQRLSAYMWEGLKARRLSSGSIIYKKMKCKEPTVLKEPTGSELMSYMYVLSTICPYYKFAYMSANVVIREAMENETKIHIIDFQIAQGGQWISFIQALARRPGGPPHIRITGIDDSQSVHARGGGLQLVEQKLAQVAESCGVPFEFHGAALSGCEVELENLRVRPGEALAVNFPYMLHHMPDESVNTTNHRDRLLRLVKSLSPKVVTLLEQESNTNTTAFIQRFRETLDYYTAMFESIDAARPRGDKQRTNAEMHCVARDIVNIIACEGVERVERHELFGKWRKRLEMAGFSPCPLSSSVGGAIKDMLNEYNENYWVAESDGALFLGWKRRPLVTSSAWR